MQRCVFCQTELQDDARFCRVCGRMQPASAPVAPPAAASGAQSRPCPNCNAPLPSDARFCANCGRSLSVEIGLAPGFGVPEQLSNAPTIPGVSAWPQGGAPGVPGAAAGPQSAAPGVSGAPAGPQSGFSSAPGAPGAPQGGAPGVSYAPPGAQSGAPGVPGVHAGSVSGWPGAPASSPGGRLPPQAGRVGQVTGHAVGRSAGTKLLSTAAGKVVAAVLAAAVVVVGGGAIAAATGHNPLTILSRSGNSASGGGPAPTATPPPPPEVTYIGSDGNIWEMTLPNGTPKQLTTDAKAGDPNTGAGGISYGDLAWAPDGSMLAVVRSVGQSAYQAASELRMLSPTGTLLWKQPLSSMGFGPVIWSPDGKTVAYRASTNQYDPNTGDVFGKIALVDAKTGATRNAITYNGGPGGCGGGGYPSIQDLIMAAHHANGGIDTFSWSPDGQQILAAYGCVQGESAAVALGSGATTPGYPAGASFQPGGHLLLGTGFLQGEKSLELTDSTGKQVRVLARDAGQSASAPIYAEGLGLGAWSSDGQTVYYEYQDGIWRVKADGSGAQQIIAGSKISNGVVTVDLDPSLSPDGKWLLYIKGSGDAVDFNNPATAEWYVAQADGSGAVALPQGATGEFVPGAVWRPEK